MLNISHNALIEVPFTDGDKVVKINGKPIILKISPFNSIAHRNASVELQKKKGMSNEDTYAFMGAALLAGNENLLNDGEPVDCDDKEALYELMKDALNVAAFVVNTAKKRKAWTLEESNSTLESSVG